MRDLFLLTAVAALLLVGVKPFYEVTNMEAVARRVTVYPAIAILCLAITSTLLLVTTHGASRSLSSKHANGSERRSLPLASLCLAALLGLGMISESLFEFVTAKPFVFSRLDVRSVYFRVVVAALLTQFFVLWIYRESGWQMRRARSSG